ncbi:PP2C family serine/threonine-protein phosphatase [Streptomyces sp. NPDC003077]|uniref:PP2C family serine/threonine-protein phosphatase n=1 Tax=Streptomyces sp. NPDC003077 TaxID=3154443 RepID=UPI0033B7EBDA
MTVTDAQVPDGRPPGHRWRTLYEHAVGANKRRYQDYADGAHGGDTVVLAVADGHGSPAHVLSHVGARCAVETFVQLGLRFAERAHARLPLPRLKADAEERLPRELVRQWQHQVLAHARQTAGAFDGPPQDTAARRRHLVPYGTTLIGAVITADLLVGWQLGDGELAVVECDGSVRIPLDPAGPQLGDETDSLCSLQAWELVRVHWAPLATPECAPSLVMLSTDGLSKSFVDHQGFVQFVRGTYDRLRDQGFAAVADDLPAWLAQAARYSGDDTTVAAAWRPAQHTPDAQEDR